MTIKKFAKKVLDYIYIKAVYAGVFDSWDDERFLKLMYKMVLGRDGDFENPKDFTEKQQWMKLYDHNPIYTKLVDKYEAKGFVAETFGEEYVIKNYGVWDKAEDIDFDSLPEQFVLKCTHDCGSIIICKDKAKLDRDAAVKFLNKHLKFNYYLTKREWPYKDVKPRIIAEEYIVNEHGGEMNDLKLHVFSGRVEFIQYDFNRHADDHDDYNYALFSRDWEIMNHLVDFDCVEAVDAEKPEGLDKLIELAEKASEKMGTPAFVRVDMYVNKGRIYFGEFTFFDDAGFSEFAGEYNLYYGELMKLPEKRI